MSGTYNYSSPSKRGARRDRHRAKSGYKPRNTGKPGRLESGGTR